MHKNLFETPIKISFEVSQWNDFNEYPQQFFVEI